MLNAFPINVDISQKGKTSTEPILDLETLSWSCAEGGQALTLWVYPDHQLGDAQLHSDAAAGIVVVSFQQFTEPLARDRKVNPGQ